MLLRVEIILVTASLLGLIFWLFPQEEKRVEGLVQSSFRPLPLLMNDLDAISYKYNTRLKTFQADQLKIRPREYGAFQVRSVNELFLTNVRVNNYIFKEVFSPKTGIMEKNPSQEIGFSDYLEEILPLEETRKDAGQKRKGETSLGGLGLVTRAVIIGLDWQIHKEDTPYISIRAKESYSDFKKKTFKLHHVRVENIALKQVITSDLMIWNPEEKTFVVPGEYELSSPQGVKKGKKTRIKLSSL